MADHSVSWKAQPHDPIRKLEDNLWMVEGDLPNMQLQLRRIMTVFKLPDRRLVIHSAIAMDEASMRELEAWGDPAFLVVPNGYHRIDAPRYKQRYPNIQVICPAESHKSVADRVPVDGHLDALPQDATFQVEATVGSRTGEGIFTSRTPDGRRASLVFCDAFFNVPHLSGFAGTLYRWLGQSGTPQVPGIFRLFLMTDRQALKSQIERFAATPGLSRLIPGHGQVVEEDAPGVLARTAARL